MRHQVFKLHNRYHSIGDIMTIDKSKKLSTADKKVVKSIVNATGSEFVGKFKSISDYCRIYSQEALEDDPDHEGYSEWDFCNESLHDVIQSDDDGVLIFFRG